MESKSLHPALTVTNIKSHVPLILEKDSTFYTTWKTLFKVHCQAYEVLPHLASKKAAPSSVSSSDPEAIAQAKAAAAAAESLWSRLDAIVLQWIYATISQPLLHVILKPGQTAHEAWIAIESEFNDNQNTRAIYLSQEFSNLYLDNFQSMDDYCQKAKLLADQLESVGSPVDNRMLVLKVLTGLTEAYDSISTVLQNQNPLPDFRDVRSRLNQEENKKKRHATRASQSAATALHTTAATAPSYSGHNSTPNPSGNQPSSGNRTRGGRGRRPGRSASTRNHNFSSQPTHPSHPYIVFPSSWTASQWATALNQQNSTQPQAPCPYPSRPNNNQSQGILGPRPDQAHHTSYSPTDIEQALYSLALNPPDHGIMDTGATSHSANEKGSQNPGSYPTMQ